MECIIITNNDPQAVRDGVSSFLEKYSKGIDVKFITQSESYVSDANGNPLGVIVPIELWREIESERETAYLLKSEPMKRRLLEAKERQQGLSLEEVREKLGI